MLFIFLIGFIGTLIGTLGGSSSFITLPAMLALGIPIHNAVGSNKFSNMFGSFSSFYTLYRERVLKGRDLFLFIPFSLTGGVLGATFASSLSKETMEYVGIILLSIAFILTFFESERSANGKNGEIVIPPHLYPVQLVLSFYEGMLGPGQSSIQMSIFQRYQVPYLASIAVVRMNTFISCLGAFITYYLSGYVVWDVALPLATGAVLGSQIALRVARTITGKEALSIIRLLVIALLLYLALKKFGLL